MYYDVEYAEALADYSLKVRFADKLEGIVKIKPEWLNGVFEPLKDIRNFMMAYADKDSGAVTWDINGNQVDLAPDTMYHKIKSNGTYVIG